MPLTAAQLADLVAKATAAQTSLTAIDTQIFTEPLNVAAVQAWGAKHAFDLTALTNDIAALVADPAPSPQPTPTPVPTTTPLVGNWNNGVGIGVATQVYCTYGDAPNWSTFSASEVRASGGKILSLAVGPLSTTQATTLAQTLVANGQANAWIRPCWEMNQRSQGWFDLWNQNAMSAAQYQSMWKPLVNAMRSVSGQKFKFIWCPNVNPGSANAPGRTDTDTFPGIAYCDYIGIDGYDNLGSVATAQSCFTEFITFAKSVGLPWQICETGPANKSDDPAYITMLSNLSKDGTCAAVCFFSEKGLTSGAGTDFAYSPNMLVALKSLFA